MASRLIMMIVVTISFLIVLFQGCECNFIENPTGGTILTNQQYTMICSLHNAPPLPEFMFWIKDGQSRGVNFFDSRINITYNASTGVSTYTILSIDYQDAGEYRCEARNNFDMLIFSSTSADIVVHGTPIFQTVLQPQSLLIGNTASFFCFVTAVPTATITWSYNNQLISNGGQFGVNGAGLTIANVQVSNTGFYKCTATNSYGSNSTSAKLTVTAPVTNPTVTITEGSSLTVGQSSDLVLHCTVSGNNITFIRWMRSGSNSEITVGVSKSSDGATLSLTDIATNDQGTYECEAVNSGGGEGTDTISVTVVALPQLSVSPSSTTKLAGQVLSESESPTCSFTGGTNGDIVWRGPNGVEVPHISGKLTIARPLVVSDGGTYQCIGANLAGTSTRTYSLTINAIPSFINTPTGITVSYGQNLLLECTATGQPTPTIQWSRIEGSLQEQSVSLPAGLQLYSVSSSDQGTYICRATNSVGAREVNATVIVTIPPHINSITPSTDYYVALGSIITIHCNISTVQGSTVSWYHNNTIVNSGGRKQIVQLSSYIWSLNIGDATYSDSGVYSCNITNGFVFDFVSLRTFIGIEASITTGPVDTNATQNEEIFLTCKSTGVPQPIIEWFKMSETDVNETQLFTSSSYRLEENGLRILNPQRTDSGYYRCVADNQVGMEDRTARVRVEGVPLAVSITPILVVAGNRGQFQCHTLYNFPAPTISWSHSNGQLFNSQRFFVNSEGHLITTSLQDSDQMDFTCTATNTYGSSSVTQFITVHIPPVAMVIEGSQVDAILDSTFTMTCSGSGRPTPSFAVYLPSGELADDTLFDSTTGILQITNFQATQAGTYICNAYNSVGSHNTSIEVGVRGSPPRNPLITPVSPTEMRVQWNPPLPQLSGKLLSYVVTYGISDLSERRIFNAIGTSAFITDLEEYTEYYFEVSGTYSGGVEGLPVNSTGITNQAAPTGHPKNITITPQIEELEINWLPLDRFDENGIILNYTLYYRIFNTSEFISLSIPRTTADDNNNTHTLSRLRGGATYEIKMQALTAIGSGPNSSVVTAVTQRAFPLVIVLSVTIPVGIVLLIALIILLSFLIYKCVKKLKTIQFYSPRKEEESYGKKKRKRTKKHKTDISNPVPEVSPRVDGSSKGKFSLHRPDGTSIPSHPKVIKPGDVAKKHKSGAKVVSVKNKREEDEYDPYEDPDQMPAAKSKRTKQLRDGFVPRETTSSDIYETPTQPRRKNADTDSYGEGDLPEMPVVIKPKHGRQPSGDEEDEEDDVVQPVVIKPKHGHIQQQEDEDEEEEEEIIQPVTITPKHGRIEEEEEEEGDEDIVMPIVIKPRHSTMEDDDDEEELERPVSIQPRHTAGATAKKRVSRQEEEASVQRRPKKKPVVEESSEEESEEEEESEDDNDQREIYARVPPAHVAKKRAQMLKEKMKAEEKKRKEKEKVMAKMRREKEKQQKKMAKMKKKEMESRLKRQSLGLDNVISLRDINTNTRAGQKLRYSIDSASADMF